MSISTLVNEPGFWLFVAAMLAFLVALKFIVQIGVSDGLWDYDERKRREREVQDPKGRRFP